MTDNSWSEGTTTTAAAGTLRYADNPIQLVIPKVEAACGALRRSWD